MSDTAARDALILKYLPMVRKVAYRMVSRFPSCVDVDDMVSIGMFGLIEAVERFQDDRSASFAAFARIRVQGAILDELRKSDIVPRSVRDRADRLARAREQLTRDLGRAPTERELARALGVTEERLRALIDGSTIRNMVSLEDGADDEHALGDAIADDADTPDVAYEKARVREEIRSCLEVLSPRQRTVVELHYFRDLNFKEIGVILDVTESRVSQIHTRVKEIVEEHLNARADEETEQAA